MFVYVCGFMQGWVGSFIFWAVGVCVCVQLACTTQLHTCTLPQLGNAVTRGGGARVNECDVSVMR